MSFTGASRPIGKHGAVVTFEHIIDESAHKSKRLRLASILVENDGELEILGFVPRTDRDDIVRKFPVAPDTVQPMKLLTVVHSPNPQPH